MPDDRPPLAPTDADRSPARRLRLLKLATMLGVLATLLLATPSTVTVSTTGQEIVRDTFSRTSTGWGSAELGGPYVLAGPGSTSGTSGQATVAPGASFTATLPAVSAGDLSVSNAVEARPEAGKDLNATSSVSARSKPDGSQYDATLSFDSGKASLVITRTNGTTGNVLQEAHLPSEVTSGSSTRLEMEVSGTDPVLLRARAWTSSSTVPRWQLEVADLSSARLRTPGGVGLSDHVDPVSSSSVVFAHDNLSVSVQPAVGPAKTESASSSSATIATPTSSRTVSPVVRRSRGTVVGSQSFAIPAHAVYVDGSAGTDTGSGSVDDPFKTVAEAVDEVPAGGTVVIRAGSYHESVRSTKALTIQNYPHEAVWFDGSVPLTTWTRSGSTWVSAGWTSEVTSGMGDDQTTSRYVSRRHPMAAHPDQVFVDGQQLTQVASAAEVVEGTFAVDTARDEIIIGSDPTGHALRASDLPMALALHGGNSTVQGIGVRRYATPSDVGAAVRLSSPGGTLRHLVITDNALQGVALSNINKTVDHLVVTDNGQLGIGGTQLDNSVIKSSVVDYNNTQHFNDEPVSGGIKITKSRVIRVQNNEVKNNRGAGLWFDASCYRLTAVNNDLSGNSAHQVELEVSAEAIVANNTMYGGRTGLLIHDTSGASVYNNKIGDYSVFGVKISQDSRRQADPTVPEAHDSRRPIPDPTVTWITGHITISNNVFGNSRGRAGFQIYALDGETNRAADDMDITVDGNLFVKRIHKKRSEPTMVAWGQGDGRTLVRYETPGELRAKNYAWVNTQAPDSYRIADMDPFIEEQTFVAKPLPDDVAAATGLPAGSQALGTY